jgi:hypothetical protein
MFVENFFRERFFSIKQNKFQLMQHCCTIVLLFICRHVTNTVVHGEEGIGEEVYGSKLPDFVK